MSITLRFRLSKFAVAFLGSLVGVGLSTLLAQWYGHAESWKATVLTIVVLSLIATFLIKLPSDGRFAWLPFGIKCASYAFLLATAMSLVPLLTGGS